MPPQEQAGAQSTLAPAADRAPAGPWRRFLARHLDIVGLSLTTSTIAALALVEITPCFLPWLQQPFSPIIFNMAILPLAMLVEAGIFNVFGNTPGKALLGVAVTTLDGQHPSAAQYLRRQFGVLWHGLALGLPGLHLVFMAAQGMGLRHGQPTPCDAGKFSVMRRRLGWVRISLLTTITAALALLRWMAHNAGR